MEFPFAREHKTCLLGSDVIMDLGEGDCCPLTGRSKGNLMLTEVVELYKKNLVFGSDGVASEYVPMKPDKYSITMNPHRRLGEPMLPSCGYSAQALGEGVAAEESVQNAAKVFRLSTQEVEMPCGYFEYLQGSTAA